MGRSFLGALAMVVAGCAIGPGDPPADAAMQTRFQEMRGALDSLVAADFAHDAHLRSLGSVYDTYQDSVTRRWLTRRSALLRRIGSRGGENISSADSSFHVPVWIGGDEEKGYAYSPKPPARRVGSLDSPRPLGRDQAQVVLYYRHIDGPWYLYRGTHVGS